ncbi:MAG: alkaline phosphatase family protein [Solirubrobacteraceae bacterium]
MARPSKLVLCVIDAMDSGMLARAVEQGVAPVLGTLIERGELFDECVAAFPSVTPVCAASIVTGARQDRHQIPGMNWYHREEGRYVEYGSSLRSAQRFGIARQLTDTVYNMNRAHLAADPTTIFERLDDADARTAGTTYLMYRGRHRHEPQRDTTLTKIAASTLMRHPVLGPRELFYADIFASRRTGCSSTLGMPGVRDRHSGCVGAYLVEHDLFDFMLLSLPDNDWLSHRHGLEAQIRSLAAADLQLAKTMQPAGGIDRFLEDHAVIVMADHSQAQIEHAVSLQDALAELGVLGPGGRGGQDAQIAVCPSQRAAAVYVLDEEERDALRPGIVRSCLELDGVELVAWLERDAAGAPREGVVRTAGGELRFASGGELRDERGQRWSVEGDLETIGGVVHDGVLGSDSHPDALARLYAALTCRTSGDVLLSAAPGWEFSDWGGQAHVGGGSHGSLRAEDSLCPVIACGLDGPASGRRGTLDADAPWAIHDVVSQIERFFLRRAY